MTKKYRMTENKKGWRRVEWKISPWWPWWTTVGGPYEPGTASHAVVPTVIQKITDAAGGYEETKG